MRDDRGVKAALLLVPLVVVSGCSGGPAKAKVSCDGKLTPADPAATLPAGIPALDGQVLYEPERQGKTAIVRGRVAQGDFVKVRDQLKELLSKAGWTIDGTDQESVEAEAQFSKQPPLQAGSIKVTPLCDGNVQVRYRLSS